MENTFLAQLAAILPMPTSPVDVDETVLRDNLAKLGLLAFPDDFVSYGRIYGSGTIDVGPYSWEIWSPFRPRYPEIVARFHSIWSETREAIEAHDVPLGLFPEPGGLLPFGSGHGVWFAWKTLGEPQTWTITAMWSYEHDSYEMHSLNFTEFLYKMMTKQIHVDGFLSPWDVANIQFTSRAYYPD